jgi:ribosomal-protein-alanine N-acetyltransferase
MRPIKSVEGRQVELRLLDEIHADGPYLAWLHDREVTRFLEARFTDYDAVRLRNYIRTENERSNAVLFGIFRAQDGKLIGTLKLSQIRTEHRNCEIGLMIGERSEWGRGHASEAITLACRYAFETLRLHKVTAGCCSDNLGSTRAFLKAGFVQEAHLREDRVSEGEWVDTLLLSRLNPLEVPPQT